MNLSRFASPAATVGTVISAASCPACFPALAGLGAAAGLTVFSGYEGLVIGRVMPLLAGIALLSQLAGWWVHRQWARSLTGAIGPALVLVGIELYLGTPWGSGMFYAGVVLMAGMSIRDLLSPAPRDCGGSCAVESTSVITCPHCGHAKEESMPTDTCVYFYECEECGALLRPRRGDCCVFCSYGDRKCPPMQAELRQRPV